VEGRLGMLFGVVVGPPGDFVSLVIRHADSWTAGKGDGRACFRKERNWRRGVGVGVHFVVGSILKGGYAGMGLVGCDPRNTGWILLRIQLSLDG
jgi:hypothetical protein